MLFAITLSYVRPIEEIKAHLDDHKTWLLKYTQAGNIVFAGPLQQENGGFVLAYGEQLSDIQRMIADDPFDVHRLVKFNIQCCDPAIRAGNFPARWAAGAKAI